MQKYLVQEGKVCMYMNSYEEYIRISQDDVIIYTVNQHITTTQSEEIYKLKVVKKLTIQHDGT